MGCRNIAAYFYSVWGTNLHLFLNERLVCDHKNLTNSAWKVFPSLTERISVLSGLQWLLLLNTLSAASVLLSSQILSTVHELDDLLRALCSLL